MKRLPPLSMVVVNSGDAHGPEAGQGAQARTAITQHSVGTLKRVEWKFLV